LKAVLVTEPGAIELAEVPEPTAGGQYLVRVEQVGICGTDSKILSGKIPVAYPRIMGHEMLGTIVEAPTALPFPAGTRVLVDPGVACGWCRLCLAGKRNICLNGGLMGRDVDGVFTELVTVPLERLVGVPASISDRAGGVLQVLGTCIHAVKTIDAFPGRVAAVIGLGVAGQLISQLLAIQGMNVIGITRSEWKRQLAIDAGVTAAFEPSNASAALDEITNGHGPDLVVEAVGTEKTLSQAISLCATGGEVLVFGTLTGAGSGLPYYELYHKELTLRNPRAALIGDYADGVALAASGRLRLEEIVTHQLDLGEASNAFALVHESTSLKVLMKVA
jgi:2-desacetyl-2-hydroxyethyl bacteriochlorophyllide A dehydrogenase